MVATMVATEVDAADVAVAAEASVTVTVVASRETSVRRKRSPTTTEKAEEVAVIMAVHVEAALAAAAILEVVEVAMVVSSATLMETPTADAITTKADRKDTTKRTVVRICDQMSLVLTITRATDLKTAEITPSEECVEVAVACAVVVEVATTLAGHQGMAWALVATKFQETMTIAEDVMKMTMPETCNQ